MTAPVEGIRCGVCMYYEMTNEREGECRRHAPQPNPPVFVTKMEFVGAFKVDTHWPKVYASNWCGQYNPRKKGSVNQAPPPPPSVKPRPTATANTGQDKDILKLTPDDE
jgi:hypothetical protein